VTGHAFEPPAEARGARRLLVEGVKNRSLPRILRPGFEHAAAANPGHRDVVGEVDGARVAFVDFRRLHAGLGVDEHLRFDRDVQRVERRTEVTARRIERQGGSAFLQLAIEIVDRRLKRRRVVIDGRVRSRFAEGVRALCDRDTKAGDEDHERDRQGCGDPHPNSLPRSTAAGGGLS